MNIQSVAVRTVVVAVFAVAVVVSTPAFANTNAKATWATTTIAAPVTRHIEPTTQSKAPLIRIAPQCPSCWMWWAPDDASRNGT